MSKFEGEGGGTKPRYDVCIESSPLGFSPINSAGWQRFMENTAGIIGGGFDLNPQ